MSGPEVRQYLCDLNRKISGQYQVLRGSATSVSASSHNRSTLWASCGQAIRQCGGQLLDVWAPPGGRELDVDVGDDTPAAGRDSHGGERGWCGDEVYGADWGLRGLI